MGIMVSVSGAGVWSGLNHLLVWVIRGSGQD